MTTARRKVATLAASLLLATCAYGDSRPDYVCGNGEITPPEQCDGTNLDGQTCASLPDLPFTGGALACADDCTWDLNGCVTGPTSCGNNQRDDGEVCDGVDLGGESCESQGLLGGALGCQGDCSGFDFTGCDVSTSCGNGVREGAEFCDGADLAGATCQVLGYTSGDLGCSSNCLFDESQCFDTVCGDGVADFGEQCDGADLAGESCTGLGWTGGDLACSASCTFDETGCTSPTCGNGTVDGGEQCDGGDLGGATCASLGYYDGSLACTTGCLYDESGCNAGSGCALLPYAESFENGVPPPGGYNLSGFGPSQVWQVTTLTAHDGVGSAYHNSNWTENDDDVLVLPCVDLSGYAGQTITLSFWEQTIMYTSYNGHYLVMATSATAPAAVMGYSTVEELGAGFNSWLEHTVDLTFLAGQPTVWIGFRYTGNQADSWYIDNVTITAN